MAEIFNEERFEREYKSLIKAFKENKRNCTDKIAIQPYVFDRKRFESEYKSYINELKERISARIKENPQKNQSIWHDEYKKRILDIQKMLSERKKREESNVSIKKLDNLDKKIEIKSSSFSEAQFTAEYEQFISELESAVKENREPRKAFDMPRAEAENISPNKNKSQRYTDFQARNSKRISQIKNDTEIPKAKVGSHRSVPVEKRADVNKEAPVVKNNNNTRTFRSFVKGKKIFIDRAGR